MMNPQQRKAIRLVVVLLVAGLAVSVSFAVLTLAFSHQVLGYQQARDPGADPSALAATLWTRPIPILLVAVLYAGVVRGLLAGAHRAYRRVRIVSVAGFAGVAYLVLSAQYPDWLRVIQGVQLAVLAALIVAVNRPVVRSAFPKAPDLRPRNRRAAWVLAFLALFTAEVSLGSVPLSTAWAWLVFLPIYGGGAVFVREVWRRSGGGRLNLLLLGVAYGLVEEGLALQSLTSTHLYGVAGWAPRLLGFNTAYTELNLVYHAVFSIVVPIALTELLFAGHGKAPYLRRGGLITTGVIALTGATLVRFSVPLAEDPGYVIAPAAALAIVAAIAALTVTALRVHFRPARPLTPPRVPLLAATTFAAAFAFLALLWPFAGATQPFFTHGLWVLLPMAAAAATVVLAVIVLRRWSASAGWTSRHLLAACVGALVGHTVFGLVGNADTWPDRFFLLFIALATTAAGGYALRRRPAKPALPGSSASAPAPASEGGDVMNRLVAP